MPEYSVSRAALLETRRERVVVEEGHRFLDEKRILIAQELLKRLGHYRARMQRWNESQHAAQEALKSALVRHGVEGLQVYPAKPATFDRLPDAQQPFLGIMLLKESAAIEVTRGRRSSDMSACDPSPEAEACADHHCELLGLALELAIARANLLRLRDEYKRTERRVRAIENVILPEIAMQEATIVDRLDELDQEEVIRAHLFSIRFGYHTGAGIVSRR
jgi:V/A-type H+-transporting ATPase subunit D